MKKKALIFFCLFVQLCAAIAQETYVDVARQAEKLSKQGKYEESYEAYTKAIGMKSSDFNLWVNRGICQMNLKKYDEALKDFNQALQQKTNEASALRGRAGCKAMLKDYKGAIVDFSAVLAQQPKDNFSLLERGKAKIQDDDIPGALTDLKECLKRTFQPAETHYWIGVAYFSQKEFKQAADAFYSATALDKTLTDAYYREALANAELGQFTKAVTILDPVLEERPKDVNLYLLRATLTINAKKYTQALPDIEKLSELQPGNTDAVLLRIKVRNGLSDYKGALAVIDSMLKIYPTGNELLFLEKGKALYQLGKRDEAEDMFEQSIATNPDFVESYHERGMFFLDKQEYRKAIADFNKAIEINDRMAIGWYLKGRALIGLEQVDEALVAINQGLDLGGEQTEVGHHLLGLAYATNGDESSAMEEYKKALSINPAYIPVRVDRASLWLKQGKTQEALQALQAVIKEDPTNATAYYRKGLAYVKLGMKKEAMASFDMASSLGNEQAKKEREALGK